MAWNLTLLFTIFFILSALRISFSAPANVESLESVPDLEKAMYLVIDGSPCVRLLNLSGEIGCANPGREKVVAPIVRFQNAGKKLARSSTVMVPLDEIKDFLARVSNDLNFAKKVAGVLVESKAEMLNMLPGFSPDEKFPQAKFSPYHDNYEWNPTGSGIMWNRYDFPIFLLSENSTRVLQEIADKNTKSKNAFPVDVAEFDLIMQGSVLSSLPPINISSSKFPKPILLAVASQDAASFFRDKSLGADSPLSGMISLLAAVDALSHLDGINELKKQFLFLIFTGEAWGYLGSRRFLAELDAGTDAVIGLNSTLIEQVLEIGSVGRGSGEGASTFYAHASGDSSGTKEILIALQQASVSLGSESVNMKIANASNPGVPPSSLMTFLRKNSSTSGVVFEEFDSTFTNEFYNSHLDSLANINTSSIMQAASVIARTLYILGTDGLETSTRTLNSINVNASLVEELVGCLLTCDPGFSCGLVNDLIIPSNVCPNHYVGVLQGSPSPYPEYVLDTSRFIWNFLAHTTAVPSDNSSSCSRGCSEAEVCIRAEIDGKGICVISTTRYVPAYSTRLKFEDGSWSLLPPNASDTMGMVDPVWTESYWDTIGLRVYTLQSSSFDKLVLLFGALVTLCAYILIVIARTFFMKVLKRD